MRVPHRCVVVGAITGAALTAGALPAFAAANPNASCIGTVTSTLVPAGALDVSEFKALARALGASNFGQFVAGGAHEHFGDLEDCIYETP